MTTKNVEQNTVVIYTVTSADSIRFGRGCAFSLWDCTDDWGMVWAEPHTYIIPDGYDIAENRYGSLMFFGPDDKGTELINDGHGRPALIPSTMSYPGDYVRLHRVKDATDQ